MVVAVLLLVLGLVVTRPTTNNSTATTLSYSKPVAAAAVDRLLMMGIRMPETC